MVSWGTTLEKGTMYNVVFKPSFQCRWASYPQKWKLFVHETYCENISFLSEANKRKVYHEIPPEPDLGVVLKEENEEEDKDKPKVSTFWKDGVVFNLAREVLQCSFSFAILCFSNKLSYLGMKVAYVMPLNPFTPKISLLFLLTVCSTICVMLDGRIWFWIN